MPNRILKDTIRTSRSVNTLTDFQFRVWAYLITYVDDFGRGSADPELLRGFVFPRRKGITEAQLEKALHDLANVGMITLYTVDGEPYFHFPNWSMHQRIQNKHSKFPAPPEMPSHGESRKITVNHGDSPPESNPIQSELELESELELPAGACAREEERFAHFWAAYPKKAAKQDAQKAFLKLRPDDALLSTILQDIERRKASRQWQEDGGKYIPYPATYLRGKRWTDEAAGGTAAPRKSDLDDLF